MSKKERLKNSYNVKIKEYKDGRIKIFEYDRDIYSLENNSSSELKREVIKQFKSRNSGVITENNLNRSYAILIDLALQNYDSFKTFITLTFKENITDLTVANKSFANWTRQIKRQFNDFKYLGVPEFQKRGAVHYHLMTNLEINSDLITLQKDKSNMFDVKYWNNGFSSVFDLSLTNEHFSVASYLTKYFYKDIDNRLFGRKKVLSSRNLDKPNEKRLQNSSKEYQNYIKYIEKYKKEIKKRDITSTTSYIPNIQITEYI